MNTTNMDKQDDKQERVIPKLRFPEFQTMLGWSNKPLSKLANRITSKNKSGEITRVFTNSASDGVVDQSDYFDREIANKDNLNGYYIIELGDYVYNPRISTVAPVGPISKNKIAKGVMSPLYTVFRFHQTDNDFYEHYFKTNCWHKYMQHVSNSGARHDRMNITNDDFMAMPVPILSPEEQQKIADCLSSIDELIELQEQKLASLKQHKKGLMQQLFPSHNDLQASKQASKQAIVYPKLRFPQFKDYKGWDVVELMNIGYFVKEKIEVLNLNPEDYISTENLLSDYGGVTISNKLPTTEKVTAFQKNDILISNIRPYLKKVWVADKDGGASNDIIVIRAKSNINTSFLSSVIKNDDFINYMMKGAKGLKMPRGDLGLISIFPVAVPSDPKEQQAIADCLSSLDKLINEENEQIGRLKDHKKGLMQQLFPIFRNQYE